MRRAAAGEDLIDETVSRLAARLPGAVGAGRAGLLLEARHGLEDAAEAYRRAGLSEREAAERAVSDFGDLDELSTDYADHAVSGSVRMTALVLGVGYLVTLLAWLVAGWATPDRLPEGSSWAASSFNWIGGLAVLTTLGALAGVRRRARHRGNPSGLAWLIGGVGLACAVATLVAAYLVEPWGTGRDGSDSATLVSGVEIASGTIVFTIIGCSLRCLSLAWAARARRRTT